MLKKRVVAHSAGSTSHKNASTKSKHQIIIILALIALSFISMYKMRRKFSDDLLNPSNLRNKVTNATVSAPKTDRPTESPVRSASLSINKPSPLLEIPNATVAAPKTDRPTESPVRLASLSINKPSPLLEIPKPPMIPNTQKGFEVDFAPYETELSEYWKSILFPEADTAAADTVALSRSARHQLKFLEKTSLVPKLGEEGIKPERIFSIESLLPRSTDQVDTSNSTPTQYPKLSRHVRQFLKLKSVCHNRYHIIPLANEKDIDISTEVPTNGDCPDLKNYKKGVDVGFVHIFKNGGSLVEKQCNTLSEGLGYRTPVRSLFAVVRDPIDHFLSGWSECGYRHLLTYEEEFGKKKSLEHKKTILTQSYDSTIDSYLTTTKNKYREQKCECEKHSYPQAIFLMDMKIKEEPHNATFHVLDPRLRFVGHLKEMKEVFNLLIPRFAQTFEENPSANVTQTLRKPPKHMTMGSNNAEDNIVKREYFPYKEARKSLSDETLQKICEFVAMDYYLFDFEIPKACQGVFD